MTPTVILWSLSLGSDEIWRRKRSSGQACSRDCGRPVRVPLVLPHSWFLPGRVNWNNSGLTSCTSCIPGIILLHICSLSFNSSVVVLLYFFFSKRQMISFCSLGYPRTQYIAQAGFKVDIPPALASQVLEWVVQIPYTEGCWKTLTFFI